MSGHWCEEMQCQWLGANAQEAHSWSRLMGHHVAGYSLPQHRGSRRVCGEGAVPLPVISSAVSWVGSPGHAVLQLCPPFGAICRFPLLTNPGRISFPNAGLCCSLVATVGLTQHCGDLSAILVG